MAVGVVTVGADAAVLPTIRLRLRTVPTGVAAGNPVPEGKHVPAMDAGDEAASEECDAERSGG